MYQSAARPKTRRHPDRKRAAARVMPYNPSRRRAAAMSEPAVYSVSELNRNARLLLREHFGAVLVES